MLAQSKLVITTKTNLFFTACGKLHTVWNLNIQSGKLKHNYGSHVSIFEDVTFTCHFGAHDWSTIVSNMLKKAKYYINNKVVQAFINKQHDSRAKEKLLFTATTKIRSVEE